MSSTTLYPQDRSEAGKHYWATLFNTAAQYPDIPTEEERRDINNYIKSTIKNFVCDECVQHSFEFIRENPIENHNREELVKYLCKLKNHSNKHEGKETIDCDDFINTSIDKNRKDSSNSSCKSCLIEKVHAPSVNLNQNQVNPTQQQTISQVNPTQQQTISQVNPTQQQTYNHQQQQYPSYQSYYIPPSNIYNPGTPFTYANMGNLLNNYPNVKRAMNLNDASAYKTQQSQAYITSQNTGMVTAAATPTAVPAQQPLGTVPPQVNELSQRYPTLAGIDLSLGGGEPQEELDGILKSLDSLYKFPAEVVGIPAPQMNLAYTPELLTNGVSLITQMYLTNAGSMLTTLLSSMTLIGISIFAKNSIANYDRLFIQNIAGSFLFHTLNFLNPRARDDLIPDLKKLFEGATKGDFGKIKESLLYKSKEEGSTADKEAQKLMNMLKSKKGIIDMKKLSKNHKDLRSLHAHGYGSTGGTLSQDEFDTMLEDGADLHGDGINLENLSDIDDEFGFKLGSGGF